MYWTRYYINCTVLSEGGEFYPIKEQGYVTYCSRSRQLVG